MIIFNADFVVIAFVLQLLDLIDLVVDLSLQKILLLFEDLRSCVVVLKINTNNKLREVFKYSQWIFADITTILVILPLFPFWARDWLLQHPVDLLAWARSRTDSFVQGYRISSLIVLDLWRTLDRNPQILRNYTILFILKITISFPKMI